MEQRNGYKKTAVGWIPEDWEVVKSKKVFNNVSKKNYPHEELLSATQNNGVIPRRLLDGRVTMPSGSTKTYKLVEEGDFVISLRTFQGGIEHSKYRGIVSPAYTILKNRIPISSHFYRHLFKKEDFISRLSSTVIGIRDGKQIKYSDFAEIYLPLPPLPEQQKIADILTTVDDKILSIDSQIQQTEQLKKGLMEKLLTKGIGHTKFKETEIGRIPVGWDVVKLGELGSFKNGINKGKGDFGHGVPFVNLMDVFGNISIKNKKFGLVSASFQEQQNYNLVKGDVLFVRSSVKPSGVGLTVLVENDLPNTIYSGFLIRYRPEQKQLTHEYKKYCFYDETFRYRLIAKSSVSANTNINQNALSSLLLKLPPSIEQKQIATILSTVDDKLDILNQKKSQYQTLKKGLSQQLLTGQMRVKV